MSPQDLVLEAERHGVRLLTRGDSLVIRPPGRLPDALKEELKRQKGLVIQHIRNQPGKGWGTVPPLDLVLNTIQPRPSASNRDLVINYLLRQGCHRPSPLTKWLVLREAQYYCGPGKQWPCEAFSYAAARDAACWQLDRNEEDVLDLIRSRQEETRNCNEPSR